MNEFKRYFKDNRLIIATTIALAIATLYLLLIISNIIFYHLDKHRCLNMPFDELKEDASCDKYWRGY